MMFSYSPRCHAVLLVFWFQAFSYRTLLTSQLGPHPVSQADGSLRHRPSLSGNLKLVAGTGFRLRYVVALVPWFVH